VAGGIWYQSRFTKPVLLADEQGLLIISEAPAVSINFDYVTPRTLDVHKMALRELIERDFNNPSVIMWSVGNEATTAGGRQLRGPVCRNNGPSRTGRGSDH
jgi:beta-galactosidase/beta-glucuronidase